MPVLAGSISHLRGWPVLRIQVEAEVKLLGQVAQVDVHVYPPEKLALIAPQAEGGGDKSRVGNV